jgi:prolipoprotein diacylglyceryl transferase
MPGISETSARHPNLSEPNSDNHTMLIHPNFDPVAIHLGPLAVRWYGLMYLVAFIAAIVIGRLRLRLPHVAAQGWTAKDIDDMLFYGVLGTILGGRLGYVLFYKASFYFAHPLDIFKVWEGGMSFHGGFLGVVIAMTIFGWQRNRTWLQVTARDRAVRAVGDAVSGRRARRRRVACRASGASRAVASERGVRAISSAAAPSVRTL